MHGVGGLSGGGKKEKRAVHGTLDGRWQGRVPKGKEHINIAQNRVFVKFFSWLYPHTRYFLPNIKVIWINT